MTRNIKVKEGVRRMVNLQKIAGNVQDFSKDIIVRFDKEIKEYENTTIKKDYTLKLNKAIS